MMALMMGYVFVSCDEEKLTPEEEKPAVNNDSIPSDTAQAPADTVSYSSLTDTITPGFINNAAFTGCGVSTNSYFTVNTGGDMWGIDTEITFEEGKAYVAKECYVTNSTYAYRAIKDHNDGGSGLVKEWTADDSFTLTITGYNGATETGQVEFKLADGFNIVTTWEKVDLSSLGEVTTLQFVLSSTDNNDYGMVTPSYFCLDQLTVSDK